MTTIEPLAAHDVEALCALAREIWRAHYPPIIGVAQTEYMLAQRYDPALVRSELARDDVWWDVLREDGAMRAFASSFRAGGADELKLDKLYVHAARQRAGLGGLLIEHTCERARVLGLRAVVLAVNKRNAGAIAAYRGHGFAIREAAVKDIGGGFVMDDYVMARVCAP
jgi:ribosomal protein S18 acetylase RimI-like enzyme